MLKTWMVKSKESDAWINLRAETRTDLFKKAEEKNIEISSYRINAVWLKNNSEKTGTVNIVVSDNGAYPTMGARPLYETPDGEEFVKYNHNFWKYPEQVDC